MKRFVRFIDRLLIGAAWWIGSPIRGLPEAGDVDVLPEYPLPRRLPFARA